MGGIRIDFCFVTLQDSVKHVFTQIVLVLQTNIIGQKEKMCKFLLNNILRGFFGVGLENHFNTTQATEVRGRKKG